MSIRKVPPRLSVNKLGEYMTAKAGRQNKILFDAKYPEDYVVAFYKEAAEAISKAIVDGLHDTSLLEKAIAHLEARRPNNVFETRQIKGNIDAIETFIDLMQSVDLGGFTAKPGAHSAPHLVVNGVNISVRPEITLHRARRNGEKLVGAIKLHFPKSFALTPVAGEYISACVQLYCRDHLADHGSPTHERCFVIDIGGARVHPGVKAIKARTRDVEDYCRQIGVIWPTI
jgi:hypothetical protein